MKLVTFEVNGPVGAQRRLGALVEGDRIVDLTTAYAAYLAQEADEPTPRELAHLRTPPDLIGWLRGQHKSREAAEQAIGEHMTRREGGGIPKRPSWFRHPPYYKGNPDSIIGPEAGDSVPVLLRQAGPRAGDWHHRWPRRSQPVAGAGEAGYRRLHHPDRLQCT